MDFFFFSIVLSGWRSTRLSLAMKRTLEVARFIWVLDFGNVLTVCYNTFALVVSTSFFSLCGHVNFHHFQIFAPLSR